MWAVPPPPHTKYFCFPSQWKKNKKTLVILNVMCLYLLCQLTLPQLLSDQTWREAFESLLKWQEGHRACEQPQGKVGTSFQKLILTLSELSTLNGATFYDYLGFERSCCAGIRRQKPRCEKPACYSVTRSKGHPKPAYSLSSCLTFCLKVRHVFFVFFLLIIYFFFLCFHALLWRWGHCD